MTVDRLRDALNDQEKVVEWQYSSGTLQSLARICHHLAASPSSAVDTCDEFRTRALQYFEQATRCEGGKADPAVYALYGNCLRDFGELEAALQMYKKVIDYQVPSDPLGFKNFGKVLLTGFEVKRKRGENVLGPVMPEMKSYYDKMCRELSEQDVGKVVNYLQRKDFGTEVDQLRVNSGKMVFKASGQ